jgi:hypothetical protein
MSRQKQMIMTVACTTLLWSGTVLAKGPTCEQRQSTEVRKLESAQAMCVEKLTRYGCDAGVCSLGLNECDADLQTCQDERDQCVETDLPACEAALAQCPSGDSAGVTGWKGLVWEKKCDAACGGLHDVGNVYAWSCDDGVGSTPEEQYCQPTQAASDACVAGATIDPADPDEVKRTRGCRLCATATPVCSSSQTIWQWLLAVNAEGLDGHDDWRIPNKAELASLLAAPFPCSGPPCVDPVIGPTASSSYWSSSTSASHPDEAGYVYFNNGSVTDAFKPLSFDVRAVRGGL